MTARPNIYAHWRQQMLEEHRGRLSGSAECLFLVLAGRAMAPESADAFAKSAESMGYGPDGATFLLVDQPPALEPDQLRRAVEGLDPVCVVLADATAASLFAAAYHVILPASPALRVFGREVRQLPDMNALMRTPAGKQRAWAALKTLPRFGS